MLGGKEVSSSQGGSREGSENGGENGLVEEIDKLQVSSVFFIFPSYNPPLFPSYNPPPHPRLGLSYFCAFKI